MGPVIRIDANKTAIRPGVYAAGEVSLLRYNATRASGEGVLAEAH